MDSLWQQSQFPTQPSPPQWQQQPEVPISMWDLQGQQIPHPTTPPVAPLPEQQPQQEITKQITEKEKRVKDEQVAIKELKKKRAR